MIDLSLPGPKQILGHPEHQFWELYESATKDDQQILLAAKMREEALSSPGNFAHYVSKGHFMWAQHLRLLDKVLVEASNKQKFVIISLPVRHGKSWLGSMYNLAWFITRFPDKKILLASYSASLATNFSRDARDIVAEHSESLAGVTVKSDNARADDWGIEGHMGRVYAAGVDGSWIGKGGDLIVIDDPVKDSTAAHSANERKKLQEKYTGTIRSRLEPGGSIVVIMSRWRKDDFAGWLLENDDGDPWEEIRLPVFADGEDDPLGREIGEALWPERYSKDELLQIKESVDALTWNTQYMQEAVLEESTSFPYHIWEATNAPPKDACYIRSWDLAAGDTKDSDYSVGALLCRDKQGFTYVVDIQRFKARDHETQKRVRAIAEMDAHLSPKIIIEQAPGAGKAVGDEYTRNVLAGFDVEVRPVKGSKESNAAPFAAQANAGNVYLCREERDGKVREPEWWTPFKLECNEFPFGKHDDQVDAVAHGYLELALGDWCWQSAKRAQGRLYNPKNLRR